MAGNLSNAAIQFTIDHDSTDPFLTITSTYSNPTGFSPIPIVFTFNESVSDFDLADITVGNGIAANFNSISQYAYSADVTPTAEGLVTIDVAANAAIDLAGNLSSSATQFSIEYDTSTPSVTITSSENDPTGSDPFTVSFTFSEPVTGFELSDILVDNGNAGNFVEISASVYTADISPITEGLIKINIPADAVLDNDLKGNLPSSEFSITYDHAPSVEITSMLSDVTNVSRIEITVTFSENVVGFEPSDILIGNGVVAEFISESESIYTLLIQPDLDGLVTVNIPANAASDSSSIGNSAAIQYAITYDATAPTINISSDANDPTAATAFEATFTFSEDVFGFDLTDIILGNATADNFTTINPKSYTVQITPSGTGTVTIDVAAEAANDSAGNGNTPATGFTLECDADRPTVTVSTTANNPTGIHPIPIKISFSELVSAFVIDDISVSNGTVSSFSDDGSGVYNLEIEPVTDGLITVDVASGVAFDLVGNPNLEAERISLTFDSVTPIAYLNMGLGETASNSSSLLISASFSKDITGFEVTDLNVTNGTAANLSGSGKLYSFYVTPMVEGMVTIELPENAVQDQASNGNSAVSLVIDYDTTSPKVIISTTSEDPTSTSPIPFSISFDEPIVGFESTDLDLSNSTVKCFSMISDTRYDLEIEPISDGTMTISVPAGVAKDPAGNYNTEGLARSIEFISPQVDVVITSNANDPTNIKPIPVTLTFSAPVTGFEITDLIITNGTATTLSAVSDRVYSSLITPIADGEVLIAIPAGAAKNLLGYGNNAAVPFAINFDGSRPSVIVSSVQNTPTNDTKITIALEFSEPVKGLTESDFSSSNARIGELNGNQANYTLDLYPISTGFVTVSLLENKCTDAASNSCMASTPYTIEYDATKPTVEIENLGIGQISFNFSEPVTGFSIGDIMIRGGTLSDFSGSGANYSAKYVGTGNNVLVSIPSDIAIDRAGNPNTSSDVVTFTVDRIPPSILSISRLDSDPTSADMIQFSIRFSEPIQSLAISDLGITQSGIIGAAITEINKRDGIYIVSVSTGTSSGAIELFVSSENDIQDLSGNSLVNPEEFNVSYTVDREYVSIASSTLRMNIVEPTNLLKVTYSEPVFDPIGDADHNDVTNTANYILIKTRFDGGYDTISCAQGVNSNDYSISINQVSYDPSTFTATLSINNGAILTSGNYRLIICGSTSITDLAGNKINGGNDVVIDILVWDRSYLDQRLPESGFAPNAIEPTTDDPNNFQTLSSVLNIPSIGLTAEMVKVPMIDNKWDVSKLSNNLGLLSGGSDLNQPVNNVIVGHNWDYHSNPGPFLKLDQVKVGDDIIITDNNGAHAFTVTDIFLINEFEIDQVFINEGQPMITLLTCAGYDPRTATFRDRLIVRATFK